MKPAAIKPAAGEGTPTARGRLRRCSGVERTSTTLIVCLLVLMWSATLVASTLDFPVPEKLSPSAKQLFREAQVALNEQRPQDAKVTLQKLMETNPDVGELLYPTATAAYLSEDRELAKALLKEGVEKKIASADAVTLLGVMAMEAKDWPAAMNWFRQAIELAPKDARMHYNLSEALRESGQFAPALEALQTAAELAPSNPLYPLKQRLTQIDAGQGIEELELEVVVRQLEENQSADWLLTAAVVHLRKGNTRQASDALGAAQMLLGARLIRKILDEDRAFRAFADDPAVRSFQE